MKRIVLTVSTFVLACLAAATAFVPANAQQNTDAGKTCLNDMKTLALAFHMCVADQNGVIPATNNASRLQAMILPYLRDSKTTRCPVTGLPYKQNPYLGGIVLGGISHPETVPLYCDAQPHPDGSVDVVYLDGHVKREAHAPVFGSIAHKSSTAKSQHKS